MPDLGLQCNKANSPKLSPGDIFLMNFSSIYNDTSPSFKNNNSEGQDASLINECLKKHFFMRSVDNKTK